MISFKGKNPFLNSCPCLGDQAHEAAEQLCSYPGVQRVAPPLAPVAAGGSLVPLPLSPCIPPTVNSIGSMSVQVSWQAEWGSWVFYLFNSIWCFTGACALRVLKLLVMFFKTAFWRKCLFFWICVRNLCFMNECWSLELKLGLSELVFVSLCRAYF